MTHSKLGLDFNKVAEARKLARNIANEVQGFVEQYTTVAVERTLCRLMGIDGVDANEVPLPNVLVDHIKDKGLLGEGVLFFIANAMISTGLSPQQIAERVAADELDLTKVETRDPKQIAAALQPVIDESLARIRARRARREEYLRTIGEGPRPYLYIIVATGNIYEDVVQAQAGARQGADIIAVIRTTGQSLLDYVPYGATTEGFGGTYATQENFRIMRKALDEVGEEVGRYIRLCNYCSGLCMPEIAIMGAFEGLDVMLNDALHGIGGGEVVVLAGVDDYASKTVDDARKGLVDERSLHVDVAEQDAVQGVVEYHIKTFQRTHGGDLRHVETRAVVAEADVAAHLLAYLIQSLAHDAEVLLGGEGTAEAFGSGAVGHIVEQALARGADHGDDVGTLTGTGLGLHHVLVDVTRSHDDVEIGLAALADCLDILLATQAVAAHLGDGGIDDGLQGLVDVSLCMHRQLGDVQRTGADGLGNLLRALAGLHHGIAHIEHHTLAEHTLALQLFHHHVGHRHIVGVDAVDAQEAAQGALHSHGGVVFHEILHLSGNVSCHRTRVLNFRKIKSYFTFLHCNQYC